MLPALLEKEIETHRLRFEDYGGTKLVIDLTINYSSSSLYTSHLSYTTTSQNTSYNPEETEDPLLLSKRHQHRDNERHESIDALYQG